MPGAFEYPADINAPQSLELERASEQEFRDRSTWINRNWQYYDGRMPEPLKPELDKVDDNVLLPKIGEIADKVVSFLYGPGIEFTSDQPDNPQTPTPVKELWDQNDGPTLLNNIGLSGAMAGHVFIRLEPAPSLEYCRIVNLNAAQVQVFWQADDISKVLWYRLQATLGTASRRIDYVREATGWKEYLYERAQSSGRWTPVRQTPWEYPWAPIIDWQNLPRPHEYYGLDDVSRAVRLNDAVNLALSNYARILKHHGSPKTVGIGFDVSDLVESVIGGFYTINRSKQEAEVFNLEMQSDLEASRQFVSTLLAAVWQSVRMIDPQTLRDKVGSLTNFGLRVLFTDAIHKTQTKRNLYDKGLLNVTRYGLQLSQRPVPAKLQIVWPDPLPQDIVGTSATFIAEYNSGLIDATTFREMRGYNAALIAKRMNSKENQDARNQGVERQVANWQRQSNVQNQNSS